MPTRKVQVEWTGIGVDPKYPLDVAGDVNCTGTFRINGTPITAFTWGKTNVLPITKPGQVPLGPITLSSGNGISFDKEKDILTISVSNEWRSFGFSVFDKSGVVKSRASGQYMALGSICFVQMSAEMSQDVESPFRITLPLPSVGAVRQSLNVYANRDAPIIYNVGVQQGSLSFETTPKKSEGVVFSINGQYRVS
jgi:hypothetical protein